MTSLEIRQSFLDFFREKEHTIVPSSSLLPDAPNLLFTNAGMNQFVPIFLGQQRPAYDRPRAADTQKCIRAGGKHNDLDDVGLDTYHHTFFEMLGNWSFGDYFKKEAIEWAWELVVRRWGLPPRRLYATVYQPGPNEPSTFDQEAHDHWAELFTAAGLDPALHIVNGNKKDNFWMMGDTGPCGPCSELHVDLTPAGDTRGSLVNADDPHCIEIWNLVFIQFNANPDGTFTPLPQRHVDTGMGFERVTAMIQGTKNFTDFTGIISNYETDIFRPIFDEIGKLSGKRYGSTLPEPGSQLSTLNSQLSTDIAFRVIADHIRTLSFAIADGIQPSNEGRGYVLRRILRRAARYGRSLGFHEPFFYQLVDVLSLTMGGVFPELREKQSQIVATLKREEESFNRTLDRGIDVFDKATIDAVKLQAIATPGITSANIRSRGRHSYFSDRPGTTRLEVDLEQDNSTLFDLVFKARPGISAKAAFELYDTYGFPLDLTQLMARERGITVDTEGSEKLMEEQRNRGRKAQKKSVIEVADTAEQPPTNFLGYEHDHTGADVAAIIDVGDRKGIVLNNSVLYAEMGGQVGDRGEMIGETGSWKIEDTRKTGEIWIHLIAAENTPTIGEHVTVRLDRTRRAAIERHHTVTHLLHWALHQVVGREATQKGSYVGPEKLTFDFASVALTKSEVREVEKLVNDKIAENAPVSWTEIPYAEAKERADIMQFFGDKYGDRVRVVQVGGSPNELNGYSMELCGGTHVRTTSEIGSFRIRSEGAIAAGIRRIEAVAGNAVGEWARAEAARQEEKFQALVSKKSGLAALPEFETTTAAAMAASIDGRAAHLEKLDLEVRDWEKASAKSTAAGMQSRAAAIANELAASDGAAFRVARVPDADGKLLQAITDALKARFDGPIFLAGEKEGRVALIASVPKTLTSRYQAGKLIQETAPLVGGKGGGRPELAQGGGIDVTKIDAALARAKELLA
jgi:alanyl-tRNA synthetase